MFLFFRPIFLFILLFFYSQALLAVATTTSPNNKNIQSQFSNSDFVLDENIDTKKNYWKKFVDYYNRHFKLNIGTSSAYYTTGPSIYTFASLTYNQSFFSWFTVKVWGELYHSYTIINYKVNDSLADQLKIDKNSIPTSFKENRIVPILRDSYLQFDITQYARLIIGRKTIVWGEFLLVSPVDLALPLRLQSQGLSISKTNSRIPQDVVMLNFYPTSKIEIETYYFPLVTLDPGVENLLRQYANRSESTADVKSIDAVALELIQNNKSGLNLQQALEQNLISAYDYKSLPGKVTLPNQYKDLDKNYQFAARGLFYLPYVTLGFTYFYGFNTVATYTDITIKRVTPSYVKIPDAIASDYRGSYLFRTHVGGLELSFPIGHWELKAEIAVSNRFQRIVGSFNDDIKNENLELKNASSALVDWIITRNNGSLNLQYIEFITAIGFDVDLKKVFISLILLRYDYLYFASHKTGISLYNNYRNLKNESFFSNPPVVPLGNLGWYVTSNKKNILGFLGGYLGIGFGGSLYFNQSLFDDTFSWAVSVEGIVLGNNSLLNDAQTLSRLIIGGKLILSYTL